MVRHYKYRVGFTAIELLIVLAIIGMLGALAASAVFRVRSASEKTVTEQTLTKLASALDVQWKAVIDSAKKEYDGLPTNIKQNLITLADNPTAGPNSPKPHPRRDDRARLLYVKFRLKQEFPTSFFSAMYPTAYEPTKYPNHIFLPIKQVPGAGTGNFSGKPAYAKAVYNKNLAPEFQSSALLLMALEQPRAGTSAVAIDQLVGSNFIRTEGDFRYIVDSWGKPLQFYVFPTATVAGASDLTGGDTQDPEGLLTPQFQSNWRPQLVPVVPPKPWNTFDDLLHVQISNRRINPTIVSAGPDGILNLPNAANPTVQDWRQYCAANKPAMELMFAGAMDNIYSFRLRQTGARGD